MSPAITPDGEPRSARLVRPGRRALAAAVGVLAVVAGLVVTPGTASAAERISVGATPGTGMSLSGPSAGGTTFRLDLPEFTQTWVRAGDPQNTTFGLWPNGSIHYWADEMSGPEQLVTPAGVRFTQIAANGSRRAPTGYALSTTGTAYAWGYGRGGQLGNGAAESSDELVPVSLPGGVQATSIGANGNGGFALGNDGDLYMWGYIPTTSPPVFGRSTATPERIPNPTDVSFTRLYVANDEWVYAWDAQGALYQWNGRVEPSIVRAPTGQSVTPPAAEVSTPEVTDVWFGSPYTSFDQTVTKSGSSWLVTTPDFRGKCGPIDVIVWYTFAGVSLEDTGSFTINTPCAPTAVSAVAGDGRATVSFSAPPSNGGSVPVTGYAVIATPTAGPGNPVTARGASSPITVTGLANGTTYDIKVIASNVNGDGGWSDQFGYQGTRTVTPQGSLAITGVPTSVTYGDAGFTLGTSGGSGSGAVTYSVQSGVEVLSVDSTTGAVTIRGAGTATVVATKAADGTVAAATASVSITVARLPITVTADDKTMPARGTAPPRTYTINPPLIGDDTLNIAAFWAHSGGVVGVDATYTSVLVQPITHPNYSVTFVPGTLTEVPALQEQAALSITGVPSSVTYGDAGFTLGTSGGSGSGAVTYSVPAGNGVLAVDSTTGSVTVVGAGTVSVTATKAGGGSYQAISTTRSVTVARRAVTVTAQDRTKVFGAADPALTFSVSPALVAGDTLTGSLTYTGSDVGAYAIVQGTVFAAPNYSVTFVPGTMTITQTAAAQAAIDDVQALPPTVSSAADADLVAEATNATAALSPAEQAQIPTEVLDALHVAQDLAGAFNHADSTHGVTASGDALPWNVRLVVSAGSGEEGEDFVSQLPGRDLLALYDLSFVDTLTGEAWEPEDGEPVTIQLSQVDVAGRAGIAIEHELADGSLETLPATVGGDGTVAFAASSFSRFGVTAVALHRTVTFDGNGRTKLSMSAQVANSPTSLTENGFRCSGYTFIGWNTAADGSGTAYADGASYPFREDVTLFAQWAKNGKGHDKGKGHDNGKGHDKGKGHDHEDGKGKGKGHDHGNGKGHDHDAAEAGACR